RSKGFFFSLLPCAASCARLHFCPMLEHGEASRRFAKIGRAQEARASSFLCSNAPPAAHGYTFAPCASMGNQAANLPQAGALKKQGRQLFSAPKRGQRRTGTLLPHARAWGANPPIDRKPAP